jgi:hypothetical protein
LVEVEGQKKEKIYFTQGDNNLHRDPAIGFEQILGRVERIEGRRLDEIESLEKKRLILSASLKRERFGRAVNAFFYPFYRVKVAFFGRKSLGLVRRLKGLGRFIWP